MTTASKRSLHPEVIKRIGRLEIRARHIVEGLLSGMHRSPYFGQSVEFLQHREYAPGDDLRRVDWKVWAKQDRLYIKQYEEDTNLRCCLLVDVSASMEYGSGAMTKYDYAVTSAAAPQPDTDRSPPPQLRPGCAEHCPTTAPTGLLI